MGSLAGGAAQSPRRILKFPESALGNSPLRFVGAGFFIASRHAGGGRLFRTFFAEL